MKPCRDPNTGRFRKHIWRPRLFGLYKECLICGEIIPFRTIFREWWMKRKKKKSTIRDKVEFNHNGTSDDERGKFSVDKVDIRVFTSGEENGTDR